MNRNRTVAALVAVLAALGLVIVSAPAAQAHSYYNLDYKWPTGTTRIVVSDRSGFDLDEVEAADSWNARNGGTAGPLRFSYTTATCGSGTALPGPCVRILTKSTSEMYFPEAAAEAYPFYFFNGTATPTLDRCDIWVNKEVMERRTNWSFRRAVIAHELGHCLGFTHEYSGFSHFTPCEIIMASGGGTDPTSCYAPTWRDEAEFGYHY